MPITPLFVTQELPITIKADKEILLICKTFHAQRDEDNRAKKLLRKLRQNCAPSVNVFCILIEGYMSEKELCALDADELLALARSGRIKLIDGHTRKLLDIINKIALPKSLMYSVYANKSLEEAMDLFKTYDSAVASMTTKEVMEGMMRDTLGRLPKQNILKVKALKTAFEIAFNGNRNIQIELMYNQKSKHPLVFNAFKHIDASNACFNSNIFPVPVLSAMLMTVVRDGSQALEFWERYSKGDGNQIDGRADAIKSLIDFTIDLNRYAKTSFKGTTKPAEFAITLVGRDGHAAYVPRVLGYYEAWTRGQTFRVTVGKEWQNRNTHKSVSHEVFWGGMSYLEFCVRS